jgi:hypothetical protein
MNYTLTDQSVTVLGDDFVPKSMPASHPAFARVVEALKANNDNEVKQLMDLPNAIASFMQGKIQVTERQLFYDGKPVTNSLAMKILQFMEKDQPELAQPLINFLEKVKQNPSRRAVEGLYDWVVRSGLPITPEGDVIAYKIVNDEYRDIFSSRFDNSVGQIVSVPRNEVDEDPDQTCSYGLHVCGVEYLPHYGTGPGTHVMVTRVNPKDFVAIPRDYNCSKARVCEYEVIGQVPHDKARDFFPEPVSYASWDDNDYDSELDEELEIGEYYRTRDGRTVQIVGYSGSDEFPYDGEILPSRSETHNYTESGSWNGYEEHPLDLVEWLPDYLQPVEAEEEEPTKSLFDELFGAFFGKLD